MLKNSTYSAKRGSKKEKNRRMEETRGAKGRIRRREETEGRPNFSAPLDNGSVTFASPATGALTSRSPPKAPDYQAIVLLLRSTLLSTLFVAFATFDGDVGLSFTGGLCASCAAWRLGARSRSRWRRHGFLPWAARPWLRSRRRCRRRCTGHLAAFLGP